MIVLLGIAALAIGVFHAVRAEVGGRRTQRRLGALRCS
jgi:hypothetical protein